MINEEEVLKVTHCGLNIYSHILMGYYPDQIVLELKGTECKPTLNPFNENKPTLKIWKEEEVFFYRDTELPDFKGNPLDFAFLHFGLTGQPLLERLVTDMYLVVGQPKGASKYIPGKIPHKWFDDDFPRFSFFYAPISNIQPGPEVTIFDVYRGIKSKRFEYRTRELRLIKSHEEARKYKARYFDYVTFSGLFTKRSDKNLVKHSGLLILDFDHVPNLAELKAALLNDTFFETQLMFISPSGDGLKWIIAIDIKQYTHLEWFNSIASYVRLKYGLEVDKSGKDVSRACFLPWDPEVYIHPKYRC
ncbi:MAG TPA: BT4734/BF3469 family protein [Prolixibacteraceae bacterium]|nr:BT4734/BF3469 family protein [Prolixibacteraceae bacterium]